MPLDFFIHSLLPAGGHSFDLRTKQEGFENPKTRKGLFLIK